MSNLSQLAQNLNKQSEKALRLSEMEQRNVIERHREAIKEGLTDLENTIKSDIQKTTDELRELLRQPLRDEYKRHRRKLNLLFIGILGAIGLMGVVLAASYYYGSLAAKYRQEAVSLEESGAIVSKCATDAGLKPCVLVKEGTRWKSEKAGTTYMEIAR